MAFRTTKLRRSFYLQPTIKVARSLLGKSLVRKLHGAILLGKIVEVEAYLGEKDPASHAYRGKTKRNEVMFLKGGHLYVYFTYGMHYCCNVVTEKEGVGHAVLLRAVEPLFGIDRMMTNRKFSRREMIFEDLTNGPAKLCQAFNINKKENGIDLLGDHLFIAEGVNVGKGRIISTERIGITSGKEHRWRFYIKGNPFVSKFQRPNRRSA